MNEEVNQALAVLEAAGIRLGKNRRRELGELIFDLAGRDGPTCEQVLKSPDIAAIINRPNLTATQKRAKVKEMLFEKRYPRYSLAKREFRRQLKELKLPANLKITPSPYFEEKKIIVEFSFSSPKELEEIIISLEKLKEVDLISNALRAAENYRRK